MYTMKECCQITGLNYDTLKFYCNEGLIPNVKRQQNNNYRVFDDNDIQWIKGLMCLKKCNFSIKEMKHFLDLCLEGKTSLNRRKEMLNKHKQQVLDQIEELNSAIDYIDKKNALYDKFLSGELEYFSYIINEDKK